jgi:hypothetical protein
VDQAKAHARRESSAGLRQAVELLGVAAEQHEFLEPALSSAARFIPPFGVVAISAMLIDDVKRLKELEPSRARRGRTLMSSPSARGCATSCSASSSSARSPRRR